VETITCQKKLPAVLKTDMGGVEKDGGCTCRFGDSELAVNVITVVDEDR
jgi:hypothetical protein